MNSVEKNANEGACFPTVHDCSTFFSADISQAKNGELPIIVYFTRLRCTRTPCLSTCLYLRFSYRMKIQQIITFIVF